MLMEFTQEDIKQEAKQEFTVKLNGFQVINCDEITDSFEIKFIKDKHNYNTNYWQIKIH